MRRRGWLVTVLVIAVSGCTGTSHPAPHRVAPHATMPSTAAAPVARLHAGLADWRLPSARSREVALDVGRDLVVAGGLDGARATTATVWWLDPASGRLRATSRLATAVHDATGFVVGRRAFVAGGGNTTTYAAVQRLRPRRTTEVVGRLPQPRSDLVATTDDGGAYVLGGFDGATAQASVLRTSDGTRFPVAARLRVTVRYPAVAALGSQLLVFGGEHDGVTVDTVQSVDLRTGRTRVVGHLPRPLAHEAAFVLDGRIWLAGGRSAGVLQTRILRWVPATGTARPAGHLPYALADTGCVVAGRTAYLVGGETPAPTDRVIVLRPGS